MRTLPIDSPADRFARLLRSRGLWLVVTMIVFLGFIGRAPITTDHERRVAETAQKMADAGWPWAATPVTVPRHSGAGTIAVNPWLVPVFENEIRLQKPPLPYWCAAILDRLSGGGPGSARFTPALLGALSILLIGRLAQRVAGREAAWVAMLAWASTHFVVDEYRKAMADPYLACFTLAAITAWVEACFTTGRRAGAMVLGFYAALGLGCLAKGPVIFLHAALAVGAFAYCFRRWPRANLAWHLAGVITWAAISLPWPIYVVRRVPDAMALWRDELDRDRNPRPFYFYLHSPFLMSIPWTYAWIASVVLVCLRKQRRLAFVHVWLAATLIVFSFVHMKKNAYLLPVAPAIAIGAAQATVRGIAFARRRRKPRDVALVAWGHTAVGVGFAIAILVLNLKNHAAGTISLTATVASSSVAMLVALLPLLTRPTIAFRSWLSVQSFAFAVLGLTFIAFPQADKRSRPESATQPAGSIAAPAE